jgi:LmbE family N-acetylglucosaminyl deacetylase
MLEWPRSVLVVATHPDDETIGCGALLGRLVRRGAEVAVVHVTDGAPRDPRLRPGLADVPVEVAASRRREEVAAALRVQGALVQTSGAQALLPSCGVPDQEAPIHASRVARGLAESILEGRYDVIIAHPYEGGHPDHDAAAFAAHAAVALARRAGHEAALVEMTSYHRAPASAGMVTGVFREDGPWPPCGHSCECVLPEEERSRKDRMLAAFASQAATLAPFGTTVERFRCAPRYDFGSPPHAGPLLYETQEFAAWRGEDVCAHLRAATADLGLPVTWSAGPTTRAAT